MGALIKSWTWRSGAIPISLAQKYLRPEQLSVALFGSLTADEEAKIKASIGLQVLSSKKVFTGGYD